jgi:HlyD family secretion protein
MGKLDSKQVNERIINDRLHLETAQSKFTPQQLTTTLSLKLKKSIKGLHFSMEKTKLELEQFIYEPLATMKN